MLYDKQSVLEFYQGKRILITGHTGFKGSWLCKMLQAAGAEVIGYALKPPTTPSLFELARIDDSITSIIGDVRNFEHLASVFDEYNPEIIIHLAAQPIVRDSYRDPRGTYETNVMGTVNVCECVRTHPSVKSFLNVTTDKVYKNNEWVWGYREDDPLDGYDPYSNSKSCSELVTHAYINSFFVPSPTPIAASTARAGNVIGGGDFAHDRIIPDCVRSLESDEPLIIRNPNSTRPYQHVLEPLFAYLLICAAQYEDAKYAGFYNIGPDECDCITTGELVRVFERQWGKISENPVFSYQTHADSDAPHEANYLKLDCSKLKASFGWKPTWRIEDAILETVIWTHEYIEARDMPAPERAACVNNCMMNQIDRFTKA